MPLHKDISTQFQLLNKWAHPQSDLSVPDRNVYEYTKSKASAGLPTKLQIGASLNLTELEIVALVGWSGGDYKWVNPIARGQDRVEFEEYPFLPMSTQTVTFVLNKDEVWPYISLMDSALTKLPKDNPPSNQILYRGHKRAIVNKIGNQVILKGFTSVSRNRDESLMFLQQPGRSNQRCLLVFLKHSSSRCLAKLSVRRTEVEVLFPRDCRFRVVEAPNIKMAEEDKAAIDKAKEQLIETIPDLDIQVVYLEELS